MELLMGYTIGNACSRNALLKSVQVIQKLIVCVEGIEPSAHVC